MVFGMLISYPLNIWQSILLIFKTKFSNAVFQNDCRDMVNIKVSISPFIHIKILTSTC